MNKHFGFLLLASCMLSSAWAGSPTDPIVILRPSNPPINPMPRPRPLSETDNEFYVYTSFEAVIVSSESVTDLVSISVIDDMGDVLYSTTASMTPGSEISISTENWESGAYTLYINYSTSTLVGDFELE